MTWWTIFTSGGAERQRNVRCDAAPSMATCGIDMRGLVAKAQPRRIDGARFERLDFASGAIVEDLALARTWALAKIDRERADAGGAVLTAGRSVSLAYARLGREADDFAGLSTAVLLTIDSALKRRARFPWLVAQIEERGMAVSAANLATVAGEVSAGKAVSEARVMKIEGKARRAKMAVRGAATVAGVLAAASVDWSVG